jgi:hypothetical protein
VNNVYIFISDSTRLDHIPEDIHEMGVSAKAVSPSTFTAPSIPSITTGKYPASHGIWEFDNQLSKKPVLLEITEETSFYAENIWTDLNQENKPPLKINKITDSTPLTELSVPFVHIEHDKGGHAPYGHTLDEGHSARSFFEEYKNQPERIRELYDNSVNAAVNRFKSRIGYLKERGLLNDTLVIFTSDHGELLGEPERGGGFGHGTPLVPEIVTVPLVFIGANLPSGIEYSRLLSGVDIAPTAIGALGQTTSKSADGVNLWDNSVPEERLVRSDIWSGKHVERFDRDIELYVATSFWHKDGGIVEHYNTRTKRMIHGAGINLFRGPHASATRKQLSFKSVKGLLKTYLPQSRKFGHAPTDIEHEKPVNFNYSDSDEKQNDIDKEQLRKLGYLK